MVNQRHPLLDRLIRLDRTKAFLVSLAIAVLGLFLPGAFGALVLYAMVAALAWLLSLTWLATPPAMRAFRLAVLALFAVIATSKLL